MIVSVPLRLPAVSGANSTLIVQLFNDASFPAAPGQSLLCAKSVLAAMLLIVTGADPGLLNVTLCPAPVLPTTCFPYVRLPGNIATTGVLNITETSVSANPYPA